MAPKAAADRVGAIAEPACMVSLRFAEVSDFGIDEAGRDFTGRTDGLRARYRSIS